MRPDQVADELYGSVGLDWVVLITAGITNVRDQWYYQVVIFTNILMISMEVI